MLKRLDAHLDRMALSLLVWLCSLPLVAFLVVPLFGLTVAAVVALVLFFITLVVCCSICSWKVSKG